jgi:chromosome partitioning protein
MLYNLIVFIEFNWRYSMSGKVISLLQKKGGATKTTTAINLLGAFLEAGFDAILCDMDKEKPDALYWADMGEDLVNYVIPLTDENPKPRILELRETKQIIILDTPPNFEAGALKASMLCDLAVIPCAASQIERNALEDAAACAMMADKPYKFLASRITKSTNLGKQFFAQLETTGTYFATQITNSVAMVECQSKGQWIGGYAPNGQNHLQYKALVNEIIETLGDLKNV